MFYCAGKLIENLKLFYKLKQYATLFMGQCRRDNPLGMLGEHNIPRGLSRRY